MVGDDGEASGAAMVGTAALRIWSPVVVFPDGQREGPIRDVPGRVWYPRLPIRGNPTYRLTAVGFFRVTIWWRAHAPSA
jgi:hypothetical protein